VTAAVTPPAADPDTGPRRRPRVVLYTSLAAGFLIAVLIAVLAASHPSANQSSPLIGKAAPAVSGPALNGGGSYSLAQYNGKWVLVNFSASWCVPCRQETPQLQKFTSQHKSQGDAVVLAVAFDPNDVSNLANYLRQNDVSWPTVNDPSAEVAFGVSQIPQSYLVDPEGTVVAKFFGTLTAAQVDSVIRKADSASGGRA
jgi:cytochrome c biogenesis protein CcmG/thiol:disulfide interchange protein DsbE